MEGTEAVHRQLMRKKAGARLVMIGHSERRHTFYKTNAQEEKRYVARLTTDFAFCSAWGSKWRSGSTASGTRCCACSWKSGFIRRVALAVSHTARSKSVVEALRIAHERGAITIGITASAKSPLLKYCSYALSTGTVNETDTGDMITRCIAEQTVLETFYLCAVDDDGKDLEEVKKQGAKAIEQMTKQDGGTKA